MSKKVAVAMIVKNEEILLARCLESLRDKDGNLPPIYIADTGSQDATISIAKKYTDNIYLDSVWADDFSLHQNFIKSKVREDWILSIDADEVLNCSWEDVEAAVELGKDMIRVQMIAEGGNRLEFGFGRLFRNSPDIYWVQKIHKHLNIPGEGENVGNVSIVFGWSPAHKNDPDRALRILERVVSEEGDAAGRNLYYLGREYWYKQRYKECTETLGRYVQLAHWPAEKAESFLVMSQAYSAQGFDEDARDSALQAIKINSNFKEAIEWMANISTPENALQWRRMARTANNKDVMWDRVPAKPVHDVILLETHQDDFSLFSAYSAMRLKPLIISITSSHLQPNRGDIGCDAETRNKESIEAAKLAGCPIVFLGIKDTELTEEVLKERLQYFNPETIYIPAYHQNGNEQHNIVNKVALEVFGRSKCEQYCSYVKGDFNIVEGGWEIKPTLQEIELKNKMLDCYKSQINLPSTSPHFTAVRGNSEWLI